MMSVRLKKHQIDKADKDSSRKFADKFNVTLFLIRPSNQTLEEEFLRPNSYAQVIVLAPLFELGNVERKNFRKLAD